MTRLLAFLICITIIGCNKSPSHFENGGEEVAALTTEQKTDEAVQRKLIKEGQVEFQTDNLNSTRKAVFEATEKYKGYVSSDQEFNSPGRKTNTIVIRVPADSFDDFIKEATSGIEKFDNKEINLKDVTEEFLDVQARLKTKKELEARYLSLLKQAKNVIEILEIEKQIGVLRSEIESIEGRLNYLNNKVSLSTLTMTFYQNISNQTQFGQKFKNGFRDGWDNLIWFFVGLTTIWPFILIGIGVLVGVRIYKRKIK